MEEISAAVASSDEASAPISATFSEVSAPSTGEVSSTPDSHEFEQLIHRLTDTEKILYEEMMRKEVSKARERADEMASLKEVKKESEKKGKKELLRRHLETQKEMAESQAVKPSEDYQEILAVKELQANIVNGQLEGQHEVLARQQEVTSPTVRDNTALYK